MKHLSYKKTFTQLLLSAVLCVLVLGPFQPLIAHAATTPPTGDAIPTPPPRTTDIGGQASQTELDQADTANQAAAAASTDSSASASTPSTPSTPSTNTNTNGSGSGSNTGSTDLCIGEGVSGCLSSIVYVFTVGIGSAFAYVAATFFNIAISLSLNGPIYALTFVSTGWTTARDLANMAFLFILIYIAFTIMLEADTSHTMSLLAGVITIALLVNFSFFFTRLVIDAGNILSIEFYNSIQAPLVPGIVPSGNNAVTQAISSGVNAVAGTGTKDLTAGIMGMVSIQGLLNNNTFQQAIGSTGFLVSFITLSFLYISVGIMLWLLTVCFVTVGIKFLVRIVVLWFLIIASPLAFVARAMPEKSPLRHYFKDWRDMLISHAFYPVAFMFIFLILTNFSNQMSQSNYIANLFGSVAKAGTQGGVQGIALAITQAGIGLGFIVVILYVGLKASDRISVMGASFAEGVGGWVGNTYKGIQFGGYSGVLRNTVGWGAYSAAQSNWLQTKGATNPAWRSVLFGANRLGKASFDIRAPLKAAGVKDVGDAQKGGYKGAFDARVKRREEEAKVFTTSLTKEQKEAAEEKGKTLAKEKHSEDFSKADTEVKEATAVQTKAAAEETAAKQTVEVKQTSITEQEIAGAKELADAIKKEADATAAAKKEIADAEEQIKDLELKDKKGTPEMDKAIANRKDKQAQFAAGTPQMRVATEVRKTIETRLETQKMVNNLTIKNLNEIVKVKTEAKQKATENLNTATGKLAKVNEAIAKDAKPEVENKKRYADALKTTAGNWSRLGAWIPKADKVAADKIRKGKSSHEKATEVLKEIQKEHDEAEGHGHGDDKDKKDDKAHAPAAHAPAAPTGGGGGGGGHAPGH